jgi:hypothetical protein
MRGIEISVVLRYLQYPPVLAKVISGISSYRHGELVMSGIKTHARSSSRLQLLATNLKAEDDPIHNGVLYVDKIRDGREKSPVMQLAPRFVED